MEIFTGGVILKGKKLPVLIGVICLALIIACMPFVGACAQAETPTPTPSTPSPTPAPSPTPTPAEPPEKVYNLKFQVHNIRGDSYFNQWEPTFCEPLRVMSDGRLDFDLLASGEVLSGATYVSGTAEGLVDICETYAGYHLGELDSDWVESGLPAYHLDQWDPFYMDYAFGWGDLVNEKVYNPIGIERVGTILQPGGYIVCSEELNLDNLPNLKMRAHGLTASVLEALGGNLVPVAFAECYSSLMTGVIDGMTGPCLKEYLDMKMYEPCKYFIEMPMARATGPLRIMANLEVWNELPADLQEMIYQVTASASTIRMAEMVQWEGSAKLALLEEGVHFYSWSDEDMEAYTAAGIQVAADVAERSPLAAELVAFEEAYARAMGYID